MEGGSPNLVVFVDNNPVWLLDALGLKPVGERIFERFGIRVSIAILGIPGWAINAATKGPVLMDDEENEMDDGISPTVQGLIRAYLAALDPGDTSGFTFYVPNARDYLIGGGYGSDSILFFDAADAGDGLESTTWWLNGAHAVSMEGEVKGVCKKRSGAYDYDSSDVTLVWKDDIDANATPGDDPVKMAIEGLYGVIEAIWNTDWEIEIKWHHED